jgi:hypothetical protein
MISPTFGRTTILDLALTTVPQLRDGDEFILVGDGPVSRAEELSKLISRVTYMHTPERKGDYGCTPWDYAIERAKGDYVWFMGDDDEPTEHAFEIIRKAVSEHPNVPHIFSMLHTGRILRGSAKSCEVSNQQFVVPRDMSKMPKYAACPLKDILISDWVFINACVQAWGKVVFHDEIICVLEAQHFGRDL